MEKEPLAQHARKINHSNVRAAPLDIISKVSSALWINAPVKMEMEPRAQTAPRVVQNGRHMPNALIAKATTLFQKTELTHASKIAQQKTLTQQMETRWTTLILTTQVTPAEQ